MSLNIIDLIKGQLGPALVSQSATQLGESESGISKAISGLIPAVLGGLANNAKNPTVLDGILGANSNGFLGNLLGGTSNNSLITTILSSVFGDKVGGLVSAVSSFAGINNSSANSLLGMVTGATLGSIGKYASDNNLDRSGISSLLEDQKGVVSSLLPAGLSLASLGLGASQMFGGEKVDPVVLATSAPLTEKVVVTEEPKKVEVNRAGATHVPVEENKGGSIWKWLLPLLLLLLLSFFAWKQCNKKETTTTTTTTDTLSTTTTQVDTLSTTNVQVTKEIKEIDVNGNKIKGFDGGMEAKLVDFLKAGTYTTSNEEALKSTWYDFDNVTFVFGKSDEITAESKGQLENLATILKAYPDAKIKIGGYTDNVGDPAANKALSQKRADFLKSELTKLGVGAQITGADGYGSEFATVPATASDAERAVDRKMSVRFAK